MVNLLYTELLKLKRSNMFLVSIVGAAVAPFMCFIAYVMQKAKRPDIPIEISQFFSDTNLYVLMLIGVLLYGVITAYLFNREYAENTLKNLLTIPVSKSSLIVSKLILLLVWIMILTLVSWGLTSIFGVIGPFDDFSFQFMTRFLWEFVIGGFMLFLLSTPVIFITLLFKDYVPTIVFTIGITMVNVLISNSEYSVLYPWSATLAVATNTFRPEYPPYYSYVAILATSILGIFAAVLYFKRVDIR